MIKKCRRIICTMRHVVVSIMYHVVGGCFIKQFSTEFARWQIRKSKCPTRDWPGFMPGRLVGQGGRHI